MSILTDLAVTIGEALQALRDEINAINVRDVGNYQDFLNGYGAKYVDDVKVQPNPPYLADPYFNFDNYSAETGAHNIYHLVPYTNTKTGTPVQYPAGAVFRTIGGGTGRDGETLIRVEDESNPRDYPYSTSYENTSSGVWDWFDIADRGTKWEFCTLGTPTPP